MTNRQKEKGKNYERHIAEKLSIAFDKKFIRVPNSGAYVGGQNVHRLDSLSAIQVTLAAGDIIPPDDMSIIVECKSRKDISYHHLIRSAGCLEVNEWIDQVRVDFDRGTAKLMLLVFKSNHSADYVCRFASEKFVNSDKYITYKYKDTVYIIEELDSFLATNKQAITEVTKK